MRALHIAEGLDIPLDAVTQKFASMGRTGSGKTYGAMKGAEELLRVGAQIVTLDPVGVWYGLRVGADGKSAGFSIPVFGGLHGDLPLEPSAGRLIADLIVDKGISAVLDVSQMIASEQARFATEFATHLFERKKAAPSAIMVFLEECQEFIPQNPMKGEERMLHAFQRLCKIGRNFGIGAWLISQRPQEVAKKVLNMTECFFAHQMTGPQEREAIRKYVAEKGGELDVVAMLPKLQVGQAHVWSPQWLQISKTVKIARRTTLDASSTPKLGDKPAKAVSLSSIDLEELRNAMAAAIAHAEENDPDTLRARIAELEDQLASASSESPVAIDQDVVEAARREGFDEGCRETQARVDKSLSDIYVHLGTLAGSVEDQVGKIQESVLVARQTEVAPPIAGGRILLDKSSTARLLQGQPIDNRPASIDNKRSISPASAARSGSFGRLIVALPPGEKAVLTVALQYPSGATREQITILTGYKRSSRDAYIQRLSAAGLVETSGGIIKPTETGRSALPEFRPLPRGAELRKYWLEKLPEGEAKILAVVISKYPRPAEKDVIDAATGYKRSSRDAYIQRLSARKLVSVDRGLVKASEVLF